MIYIGGTMTRRAPIVASCLFAFIFLSLHLFGQTTEADIKAQLKDKPLYLRGFWRGNDLRFDSDGKLSGTSNPTTFTLAGFDFGSAHLKNDKLVLEGDRMGTEFNKGVPNRVSLGHMRIEIGLPPNADFAPALHAIFVDGLPALVPSLPAYWQDFGSCLTIASVDPEMAKLVANCTRGTVKGRPSVRPVAPIGLSPPHLIKRVDANFSEQGKEFKKEGTVLVGLVVSEKGLPTNLTVLQPLGLAMDENALLAVAQFRFAPATLNGTPASMEINIEVNFAFF